MCSPLVVQWLRICLPMGSVSGLGRSHMPRSDQARVPQLLGLCYRAGERQLLSLCAWSLQSTAGEAAQWDACTPQWRAALAHRSWRKPEQQSPAPPKISNFYKRWGDEHESFNIIKKNKSAAQLEAWALLLWSRDMKNVKNEGSLPSHLWYIGLRPVFSVGRQEIWFKTFTIKWQLEISREKDKKLLLSVSIWVPPHWYGWRLGVKRKIQLVRCWKFGGKSFLLMLCGSCEKMDRFH